MTSSSGETRTKVTLKETGTTDTSDGFKPPEKPASANRSKVTPDPAPVRSQPYHGSTLEDLKYEVLSLRQKHEILQKEVARIRKDKIKPMELILIKSQISLDQSESSLSRISDFMNQLCETSRAVSALKLVCAGAEKRIREELMRRDELLREHEEIDSYLVIEDKTITVNRAWERPSDIQIVAEIEILERKLDSLKRSIASEMPSTKAPQMKEALSLVMAAAEMESNLNVIGTADIKEEIAKLKEKKITTKEQVKAAKAEVAEMRSKVKELKSQPASGNAFDPGTELTQLDSQILSMRGDVERVQQENLALDQEIMRMRLLPLPVRYEIPAPEVDVESSESSDEGDDFGDEMEKSLRVQANLLRNEVNDLQERYNRLKSTTAARQRKLKHRLKELKERFEVNTAEVHQRSIQLEDGEPEHEMGLLMESITGKIEEMKRELSI